MIYPFNSKTPGGKPGAYYSQGGESLTNVIDNYIS